MASEITEEDISIISKMNLVITGQFIENDYDITDKNCERLKQLFPDLYVIMKDISFEELMKIFSKFQNHVIYGEYAKMALSQRGREWIKKTLKKIQDFAALESECQDSQ